MTATPDLSDAIDHAAESPDPVEILTAWLAARGCWTTLTRWDDAGRGDDVPWSVNVNDDDASYHGTGGTAVAALRAAIERMVERLGIAGPEEESE